MLRYRIRRNRYFESNSPELDKLMKEVSKWKSYRDDGWSRFRRSSGQFYYLSEKIDDVLQDAERLGADDETLRLLEEMSNETMDIAEELSDEEEYSSDW